ncbi:MAG: hypothetical protein Q4A82_04950 [Corynebacterium sp.]|nr:hypothetical protein [Corynebacterium sp.]
MKITRSLVAGGTALAVAFAVAPAVAPVASAQSSLGAGIVSLAMQLAGLAIFVAFWGTVYNFLVNHGTVPGRIIPGLPVF